MARGAVPTPGGGRGRTWAGVASMIRVPDEGDELKARRRRPVTATGQNTVTHRKAHVVVKKLRNCTSSSLQVHVVREKRRPAPSLSYLPVLTHEPTRTCAPSKWSTEAQLELPFRRDSRCESMTAATRRIRVRPVSWLNRVLCLAPAHRRFEAPTSVCTWMVCR